MEYSSSSDGICAESASVTLKVMNGAVDRMIIRPHWSMRSLRFTKTPPCLIGVGQIRNDYLRSKKLSVLVHDGCGHISDEKSEWIKRWEESETRPTVCMRAMRVCMCVYVCVCVCMCVQANELPASS